MLETGLLDETDVLSSGTRQANTLLISTRMKRVPRFSLSIREHSVYLTGKDIREIQLAKAAICAGFYTLLDKAGLSLSDVSSVVLAGGFGSHIDKASACRIGLIPRELEDKIAAVGNAAGAGAVAILLGGSPREAARTICDKSDYTSYQVMHILWKKYIEEMMFE